MSKTGMALWLSDLPATGEDFLVGERLWPALHVLGYGKVIVRRGWGGGCGCVRPSAEFGGKPVQLGLTVDDRQVADHVACHRRVWMRRIDLDAQILPADPFRQGTPHEDMDADAGG